LKNVPHFLPSATLGKRLSHKGRGQRPPGGWGHRPPHSTAMAFSSCITLAGRAPPGRGLGIQMANTNLGHDEWCKPRPISHHFLIKPCPVSIKQLPCRCYSIRSDVLRATKMHMPIQPLPLGQKIASHCLCRAKADVGVIQEVVVKGRKEGAGPRGAETADGRRAEDRLLHLLYGGRRPLRCLQSASK
jgi:hypothetical protein